MEAQQLTPQEWITLILLGIILLSVGLFLLTKLWEVISSPVAIAVVIGLFSIMLHFIQG